MSIEKMLKNLIIALFIAFLTPIVVLADGNTIPPSDINDLAVVGGAGSTSVQLTWAAPSADGNMVSLEQATSYDMRIATAEFFFSQWSSRTVVTGVPTPSQPGMQENFTVTGLTPNTTYYIAVRGVDSFGLLSPGFNLATFTTTSSGPSTVSNVIFTPQLEGVTIPASKSFTIALYSAGTLTKTAELTATSDTAGKVALPSSVSPAAGLYDILVSSPDYLRKKIFEYNLASSAIVALPTLPAGDFNGDSIINSLDSSYMGARWFTNNAMADINKDGIVNSIDWSFLGKNWFKTGD